ncbi:RNA polymerase sigma factor [Antrihabitans spumae]|uniref:RNA polymerase sigma factor n=1 Tax=Antrihabitans spumae TaxID=3373370 RepID=A0ABW7KDP0_9NOCA
MTRAFEDLLRELAPQVLGALVRRYGHFDVAEDAVQEALIVAAQQWPRDGTPIDPRPWLIRVASRKMIDLLRADQARRDREDAEALAVPIGPATVESVVDQDDSLILLFMCCHPALTQASQVALTLRAVGGLTTGEIARALLVPDATMGQRISRAKQTVKRSGVPFRMPPAQERAERLDAVLQVLYLIFNEGYSTTSGAELLRIELSGEAIRLTRMLHATMPEDGEVAGLLALMLLTDARRRARADVNGALVPMGEQNRHLWDRAAIDEGVALVTAAMSRKPLGPYQLQAAIAAVHDEAPTAEDTDWVQILGLYLLLERTTDNPMVRLNRAVAVAMVRGPQEALDLVEEIATDERVADSHRVDAVRAHLYELAGDLEVAVEHYRRAARGTTSTPEQRYLRGRATRLGTT